MGEDVGRVECGLGSGERGVVDCVLATCLRIMMIDMISMFEVGHSKDFPMRCSCTNENRRESRITVWTSLPLCDHRSIAAHFGTRPGHL